MYCLVESSFVVKVQDQNYMLLCSVWWRRLQGKNSRENMHARILDFDTVMFAFTGRTSDLLTYMNVKIAAYPRQTGQVRRINLSGFCDFISQVVCV
jgi:hypothetical protein